MKTPQVGIEPTTFRLEGEHSSTESQGFCRFLHNYTTRSGFKPFLHQFAEVALIIMMGYK